MLNTLWQGPYETMTKDDTRHQCLIRDTYNKTGDPARLPAQLAGGRGTEDFKYGVRWGKIIFYWAVKHPWQNKNLLYRHYKPNEPTKEGSHSIELFKSPSTSVSTVSRGHPSLVYLSLIQSTKCTKVTNHEPVKSMNCTLSVDVLLQANSWKNDV
jgi:hypothetical protein